MSKTRADTLETLGGPTRVAPTRAMFESANLIGRSSDDGTSTLITAVSREPMALSVRTATPRPRETGPY
jgi:hypothetical protein